MYYTLFSVTDLGTVLLAWFHEERLAGEDGRARAVSICLYLRQRTEDMADTCLLNKAVMNKAQMNALFNLHQSAPSALPWDCFAQWEGNQTDPQPY